MEHHKILSRKSSTSPLGDLDDTPIAHHVCPVEKRGKIHYCRLHKSYPCSTHAIVELCEQVDEIICGQRVDRLKLATALIQPTPVAMALKLMSCLFTTEELVNGNPSGLSKFNNADTRVVRYIEGKLSDSCSFLKSSPL